MVLGQQQAQCWLEIRFVSKKFINLTGHDFEITCCWWDLGHFCQDWTFGKFTSVNFESNTAIFFHCNAFETVICKMSTILSGPQCVKSSSNFPVSVQQTVTRNCLGPFITDLLLLQTKRDFIFSHVDWNKPYFMFWIWHMDINGYIALNMKSLYEICTSKIYFWPVKDGFFSLDTVWLSELRCNRSLNLFKWCS